MLTSINIEKMKNLFLQRLSHFCILTSEVHNCIQNINRWKVIAQAKDQFKDLKYESFWAWIQRDLLFPILVINLFKISDDTIKTINKIKNGILTDTQKKDLFENSKISSSLKDIKKIISPIRPWRNYNFAHIELEKVESLSFNFEKLVMPLENLAESLSYIRSFLLNPKYLIKNQWDWYRLDFNKENASDHHSDEVSQDILKLLYELHP